MQYNLYDNDNYELIKRIYGDIDALEKNEEKEPKRKKKWYEMDEEPIIEPKKTEPVVRAPSELRSKQMKERLDKEAIKLFGKSSEQLDKDPTVVLQVQNGSQPGLKSI